MGIFLLERYSAKSRLIYLTLVLLYTDKLNLKLSFLDKKIIAA